MKNPLPSVWHMIHSGRYPLLGLASVICFISGWVGITRGIAMIFPPDIVWWISSGLLSILAAAFIGKLLEN